MSHKLEVIPVPLQMEPGYGSCTLSENTVVACNRKKDSLIELGDYLKRQFELFYNIRIAKEAEANKALIKNSIALFLDESKTVFAADKLIM